jgi:Protein of unknown function (DUF2442)
MNMEKAYNISKLDFEKDLLLIIVDNKQYRFKMTDISEKLAKATDIERRDFRITPSGYGIHWRLLDEDLSINGLLQAAEKETLYITRVSKH